MINLKGNEGYGSDAEGTAKAARLWGAGQGWRKIGGLILVGIGFLLSPLCWWNDLIFNLPLAYGFGYLCSWIVPQWLIPGAIAGYWLSNLVGIVLMQAGTGRVLQSSSQATSFKQTLWSGVLSSTAFTVVVVLLVHWQVLDLSSFDPSTLFLNAQNG